MKINKFILLEAGNIKAGEVTCTSGDHSLELFTPSNSTTASGQGVASGSGHCSEPSSTDTLNTAYVQYSSSSSSRAEKETNLPLTHASNVMDCSCYSGENQLTDLSNEEHTSIKSSLPFRIPEVDFIPLCTSKDDSLLHSSADSNLTNSGSCEHTRICSENVTSTVMFVDNSNTVCSKNVNQHCNIEKYSIKSVSIDHTTDNIESGMESSSMEWDSVVDSDYDSDFASNSVYSARRKRERSVGCGVMKLGVLTPKKHRMSVSERTRRNIRRRRFCRHSLELKRRRKAVRRRRWKKNRKMRGSRALLRIPGSVSKHGGPKLKETRRFDTALGLYMGWIVLSVQ